MKKLRLRRLKNNTSRRKEDSEGGEELLFSPRDSDGGQEAEVFVGSTSERAGSRAVQQALVWQSKMSSERFFFRFSAVWILVFGLVVGTKMYESFGDVEYMALALFVCLPYFLIPHFFPCGADRKLPFHQRYYVKANVWMAIFSYVGNYFWTHYFYTLLEARYTFPIRWELNRVPICLYLITHGYFMSYHVATNFVLRRFYRSYFYTHSPRFMRLLSSVMLVFLLSYFTAFMETFTIASVPYYSFKDRNLMYLVGSAFYGIYFYVSFPMFLRVDEHAADMPWTVSRTAIDALGASMLVTIILDLWRIVLGGFSSISITTLPWLVSQ